MTPLHVEFLSTIVSIYITGFVIINPVFDDLTSAAATKTNDVHQCY